MKPYAWMILTAVIMLTAGMSSAQTPRQLGPFGLGQPITDCENYIDRKTVLPVRYMEYIHEVEIKPIQGFKSGLIEYSTCKQPGRIVRIKLKYADNSRQFYDKLIKRIEERFGKRSEYRGDPFHVVVAWKWSFVDSEDNRISLIVQHNTRDEEEKMGNSIKLTLTSKLDEYRECYEKKQAQADGKPADGAEAIEIPGLTGWDLFVPR